MISKFLKISATLLFLVLVCSISERAESADSGPFKGIQSTGVLWFQFGPAIFSCCKRVDWYKCRASSSPKITLTENDANFKPFIEWARQQFAQKLACAPKNPCYQSLDYDALVFYSTVNAEDSQWFCEPHMVQPMGSKDLGRKMYNDLLLVVPLVDDTFGYDEATFNNGISKIKGYFQNEPKPNRKTSPKNGLKNHL